MTGTALLLIASVGIGLAHRAEMPLDEAMVVVDEVRRAVERRTGPAPLDDPSWATCEQADRCAPQVRARLGVDEVLLVSVYRGIRTIRVVLDRSGPTGQATRQVDLTGDRTAWRAPIEAVVSAWYGPPRAAPKAVVIAPAPSPAPAPRVWPWIGLGAGVVAGAGAVAFGASSRSAGETAESRVHTGAELDALAGRQRDHGVAAIALGVTAAAAITTSVLLWLVADSPAE